MINPIHYNSEEREKWISFRNSLSSLFPIRTGAVMNIIDSLSSNIGGANTAVAISENDLFNYNYNSVYKGINNSFSSNLDIRKQQIKETQQLIISTLSLEEQLPSSRVFYTLPKIDHNQPKRRGHPQWYGNKFDLKNESTWHEVDEQFSTTITNHKDEIIELEIKCWHNLIMKGDKEQKMQQKPFNLLRITLRDKQGNFKFNPMWLIVMGERKNELSLFDCYQAYLRRFDIEHLFRFAKNKLLLNNYYSTNVERENNWVELVFLSYVNLWASRNLAQQVTPDWQKYYQKKMPDKITPSIVQRDYKRIIRTFGTAVPSPKVRGYSSGRKKGTKLSPRLRYPTVKKTASKKKAS